MNKKEKDKLIRQALKKAIRLYFGRLIVSADRELQKLEEELGLAKEK